MVVRDQHPSAFVINPFEENIRIERNVIAAIKQQQAAFIKQKLAEAQKRQAEQKVQAAAGQGNGAAGQPAGQQGQSAPGQAQRTVTLSFHRIEKCPEKFLEEARTYLKTQPVKKAYLQGLMQGDRKGCLFVLDHEGDEKALFNELAKISKPYMPGMYLYATTVNSDLGKKAINGMEPFYEA